MSSGLSEWAVWTLPWYLTHVCLSHLLMCRKWLSPLSLSTRHQVSAPWIVSELINNLQMTPIPNNPNIQSLTFIKYLAQDLYARNHDQFSISFALSYHLAQSWKEIRLENINYSIIKALHWCFSLPQIGTNITTGFCSPSDKITNSFCPRARVQPQLRV